MTHKPRKVTGVRQFVARRVIETFLAPSSRAVMTVAVLRLDCLINLKVSETFSASRRGPCPGTPRRTGLAGRRQPLPGQSHPGSSRPRQRGRRGHLPDRRPEGAGLALLAIHAGRHLHRNPTAAQPPTRQVRRTGACVPTLHRGIPATPPRSRQLARPQPHRREPATPEATGTRPRATTDIEPGTMTGRPRAA